MLPSSQSGRSCKINTVGFKGLKNSRNVFWVMYIVVYFYYTNEGVSFNA
jgi:hypothetical protein